jgi:Cd2+/Zn2+-exporting ATPase
MLASRTQVLAIFAVADASSKARATAVAELQALGVRRFMLSGDNEATARTIAPRRASTTCARRLAAYGQAGRDQARCSSLRTNRDDRGRHQRRAGARAGRYRYRDGRSRHRYRDGSSRHRDHERRSAPHPEISACPAVPAWSCGRTSRWRSGSRLVFLCLQSFGSATMWMAVFADMGASLIVVFNGLRLLRGVALGADQSIAS